MRNTCYFSTPAQQAGTTYLWSSDTYRHTGVLSWVWVPACDRHVPAPLLQTATLAMMSKWPESDMPPLLPRRTRSGGPGRRWCSLAGSSSSATWSTWRCATRPPRPRPRATEGQPVSRPVPQCHVLRQRNTARTVTYIF